MITSITEYYNRRRHPAQVSTIRVWFTDTPHSLQLRLTMEQYLNRILDEFYRVLQNEVVRPYRLTLRQEENIPVFLVMHNTGTWRTAYENNTLEMVLTIENMISMVGAAQQSNAELNVFDTQWELTIDSNFYTRGSGGPIQPKYTNKAYETTHQVHYDDQGTINCAAFALSYRMNKSKYHHENRDYMKRKILQDARALQSQLGWTDSVHQDQLQQFVDLYPEYRVTVLNPSGIVKDFKNSTFTGSQYVFVDSQVNERSSKTLYLGLMNDHWYAIRSPSEYFRQEGKVASNFCHKCVYRYHSSYRHDCDVPGRDFKKRAKTKQCEKCGIYLYNSKCTCQETGCATCCVKHKTGLKHNRCLVTKPSTIPKSQEAFANGEDKNHAALWVYDLESCMETIMVEKEQIVDFDIHGIPVRACNIYKHQPNLVVAKNVITGEMKEWYGERSITEMVNFMITYNYGNNILIAHNASGYDSRLVYEEITRQVPGIEIKCLFRGSKILSMTATKKGANRYSSAKLVFKDSMLHLPGSLAALAKAFCKGKMIKGYFPHLFNVPENQNYNGPIPDKKYFDMTMSARDENALQAFEEWYDSWEGSWDFKSELIKYCRNDVDMLADIVQQYDQIYFESFGAHPFYYTTTPAAMQDVSLRQQRERMNIDRECFSSDEEFIETVNKLAQDEEWATLLHAEQNFARQCLRGGKTEIRRVYYQLTEEDKAAGRKIVLQDICSQYPYQQVVHEFPVGVPLILVWDYAADYIDEKMNIKRMTTQPTYEEIKHYRGFICCDIEPPNNLFHATLIESDEFRNKAISSLEFKTRKHFVFDEVKVAIERDGYILKHVYRFDVYNYRTSKWTDLVLRCYLNKMKYSKNTPNEEEQERLIQAYEERFDFGNEVKNSFPEWEKNDAKKLVFKIGTNSIWGKNAENTERDDPATTLDCETSLDRMNLIFQNINEQKCLFKSMHLVGNMHQIITKSNITQESTYHNGYLPAAVCVPSYGRMQLNAELVKLKDRVLMHDTDSIMYIYDPQEYNIPVDDVLGGWEIENDKIEEFVGIAPKTYAYKCSDGVTKVKCKGVSLTNFHKSLVNFDTMKDLVTTYLETKTVKTIQVPQRSFDYQVGSGMATRKFLKQLRFNPNDMKGVLDRRDGKIYPFGHVMCSDIDNWEYINQ